MSILESDLATARDAWGLGLIAISQAYESAGIDGASAEASRLLDNLYGYNLGPVLFKPTMASGKQTFRLTKQGALAYFVGHSMEYPLDSGFGLKGWRDVQSETAANFTHEDVAMWMGKMTLTDKNSAITQVDKSFGYKKDNAGVLRIVLHHSSLPYLP